MGEANQSAERVPLCDGCHKRPCVCTTISLPNAESDATGPGWFWTQAEWAEWSNTLASLLPEEYDDDVAQEAIIERAVLDMATQLGELRTVLTEYEDAGAVPAPYTNERALYERICSALGRESDLTTPPGSAQGGEG